ncbi:MAG: PepSY domain-containing protein [Nitrospirae bacterium]|nr:PepSY domain-containing protein [Nitrospirota bacterium]
MKRNIRGDEGRSGIGEIVMALVMVLISVVVFAGQAELKKDKGADDGRPKRTIHGKPVNRHAVEMLIEESEGDAEVEMNENGEVVRKLKGKFKIVTNKPVEDAVLAFIDRHGYAFGLKDAKRELRFKEERINTTGKYVGRYYFEQTYNGIPIWTNKLTVAVNKDNEVEEVVGWYVPTPDIDTTPLVTKEEAIEIVRRDKEKVGSDSVTRLIVELVVKEYHSKFRLAYYITCLYQSQRWLYFIDAKTGEIISKGDITF